MVFGGCSGGGRDEEQSNNPPVGGTGYGSTGIGMSYGAVAETDTVPLLTAGIPTGSSDDSDECSSIGLTADNCYQRQPLLPTHQDHYKPKHGEYHDNGINGISGGSSSSSSSSTSSNFFNTTAANAVNAVNGLVKIQMPSPHRDEPRFPKEKLKTFYSLIFLVVNAFLTTTSLALTHELVPTNDPPLPDIMLDSFPNQQWGLDVSEIIIICVLYFTTVIVVFHKHRYIVFRRVFIVLGLLYFYRSITMYVTVLPVANPSYYCSPKLNHTSVLVTIKRSLQLLSGLGLSISGQHTYCGDYIFSGHTSVLVLAYLIVKEYTPRRWWLLHWLYALLALTGIIMVLIARGHYTVDCVLAYYVVTRIWYIYHTMANNPNLKEAGQHNYFSRMWWFPVFRYFEGNVGGCVPRHYEWPLPWPRRWGAKLPQRTS